MLRDGRYWDILESAGKVSRPIWQDAPNGVITDPARGWIESIMPQGDVVPPPSDLEERVARIEAWIRGFKD
jgi:hypothetical protein